MDHTNEAANHHSATSTAGTTFAPPDLRGRRVLVTGGASGLGAAVVDGILAVGGQPLVLDRQTPNIDVPFEKVDLADTEGTHAAVLAAVGDQEVHAVVTCAGIDVPGPIGRVDAAAWELVVRVNLFGTAAVIRAALPSLRRSRGRIVAVASTLGHRGVSDASAYCASKFGVVGLTRALMSELRGEVGVTLLTPGGMTTSFFDGRDVQYQPPADAVLADPVHIAESVVYVLTRPATVEVRELVIASPMESTWP